jgi:formylglycine-generating enzyme
MKMMKNVLISSCILLIFSSCANVGDGELTGVIERPTWENSIPFGMLYMPMGSFSMGPSDQDAPWALTAQNKTVSLQAFWMDETEITNNEYRQFVNWVRDSLAYRKLGDANEKYLISQDEFGEEINPPFINWSEPINWTGDEEKEALQDMFLAENERFFRRKEIDTRKLNYEYFWIDLKQAAQKHQFENQERRAYNYKTGKYDGEVIKENGEKEAIKDRSSYIMKDILNVYPDTLCWISDFTYAYNEPMATMYFWHPAYDNYPTVGITWKQANAFSIWRTQLKNGFLKGQGQAFVHDYRLPTETEWEYASRGGLNHSMYPWGGYYTRNYLGCFIANFKPMRGNYTDDGGIHTVVVAHYEPNEWGLYDMAGNASEWTISAFDESAYSYIHDLNSDYKFNAVDDDSPTLKRKVLRGGSWKDVAYYLQCGSRTFEYQDSSKSYIGFRCVRTYEGRKHGADGVPGDSKIY